MENFKLQERTVAYTDTGRGPTVILAHGSGGSHRQWSSLAGHLQDQYRVLVPDLTGYGESEGWSETENFNPFIDVELLEALCEMAGEAVHLVGYSYGGAMSLEVARRGNAAIRSLSLIEPVSFHLLRPAGREQMWRKIHTVANAIGDAVKAGDKKRAANIFMPFWIGRITWWLLPRHSKQTITNAMDKVAHEFRVLDHLPMQPADYHKIELPIQLIMGARTRKPARTTIEVINEILPAVQLTIIKGAGHMVPFSHSSRINDIIYNYISQY